MVDLVISLGASILATFIPLNLGLFAPRLFTSTTRPKRRTITFLAAAAAGIIFWFFLDVMGDAALLDVNQGFRADDYIQAASHLVIALLFAAGLGILFLLEMRLRPKTGQVNEHQSPSNRVPLQLTLRIAALAALAIGLHALGEGIQVGASLPRSSNILEAIGGVGPGIAYVLHKVLEGFVVGVFAILASPISKSKLSHLGIIAGVPTVIGFVAGFVWLSYAIPIVLDSSYFFALGAAGAMYIEIKLIPVFARTKLEYASIAPALLGFYAMYVAGLFHS